MRVRTPLAAAVVASTGLLMACAPCDEDACEALRTPTSAKSVDQGIVGIVAYRTDAGSNGCFPCNLATARVVKDKPSLIIEANQRYEQPFEVGDFLVCVIPGDCASIRMAPKKVMTINAQRVYGLSTLRVFEPKTAHARTDGIFRIHNLAGRF